MCHLPLPYHPWRHLRGLADVVVHWQRPHPAVPAATDGRTQIWMDPRLSQVERRCVLAHELVHVEAGHAGCQPPAVESAVRRLTARRLIDLTALEAAVRWTLNLTEIAEDLWVTPMVLTDRIDSLSAVERSLLLAACEHHHTR